MLKKEDMNMEYVYASMLLHAAHKKMDVAAGKKGLAAAGGAAELA